MVKPEVIFGQSQEIPFTIITWNPSETVRADGRTLHAPPKYIDVTRTYDTTLDVMLENILKITGTLMEKENYQMHGQVSQDSLYCKKNTGWIYMVQEETYEETNNLSSRQCMARYVETYV